MSKALRKQGAEVLSEKKYPLPVNGLHSGPRVHKNIYLKSHEKGRTLSVQNAIESFL